jgi:hypothetical protein
VAGGINAKGQGPDYADLLDRMADGVTPCPDPDCEWCADTTEAATA